MEHTCNETEERMKNNEGGEVASGTLLSQISCSLRLNECTYSGELFKTANRFDYSREKEGKNQHYFNDAFFLRTPE